MMKKVLLRFLLLVSVIFLFVNIKNYKTEIVDSEDLAVYVNDELVSSIPKKGEAMFIKAVCDNDGKASWDNDSWGLLVTNMSKKTKCNLYFYSGDTVFNFDYTGGEQVFTVPVSGTYKLETWGAQGGKSDKFAGGLGGYTQGLINISQNTKLYVLVGGEGTTNGNSGKELDNNYTTTIFEASKGGYNGGGTSGNQSIYNGSGGGATDIRLISSNSNSFLSLKSRIMVSGGGGGSSYYVQDCYGIGGSGGGLIGIAGTSKRDPQVRYSGGGTQTGPGYSFYDNTERKSMLATFGGGGKGFYTDMSLNVNGGGGGGYYGGSSGGDYGAGGAGGSSFISGHNGCDAIKEESTEDNIIHTGQSIHYSGYYFTDTIMIDGEGYKWTDKKEDYVGMPSHSDNTTMTGNTGNGYARITLVSIDE